MKQLPQGMPLLFSFKNAPKQMHFSNLISRNRLNVILSECPTHIIIQVSLLFTSTRMLLLKKITRYIAHNPQKTWSQAQPIFKDYYSRRLTLTPHDLQQFLLKLSGKQFSESDHRWTSLLQNIESNLSKFQPQSQIYMLKALSGMSSKSQLTEKIFQNLMLELKALTFDETSILLWCLSKFGGPNKVQDATKIFEHLCKILTDYEQAGELRIVISKQENKQFQKKILALRSTSICMVLSAMAKLAITQKTVLKHLLRSGVKPNLSAFSCNGLVTLLVALEKLGLRNKRDSLAIYLEVRQRIKELEVGPLETLENLTQAVSNLAISKHFDEQETDGRPKPLQTVEKLRQIRNGMTKFVLWLCQTVQLRQNPSKKETASKILFFCSKVQAFHADIWSKCLNTLCQNVEDCKIVDLVMAIQALAKLPDAERKMFSKMEEQISQRFWALHSSFTGKSLQTLANLYQAKKISPPHRVATVLSFYISKKRAAVQKGAQSKQASAKQEI